MPKRHRQPEPVNILKVGRIDNAKPSSALGHEKAKQGKRRTTTTDSTAGSIASSASGVFPATPSAWKEKQAREDAREAQVRAATMDGGGADALSTASSSAPDSQPQSEVMSYNSSLVGDDGNQDYYGSHSDEDVSVSESEQDDMRAMRRAVRANRVAAASRRKGRAFDSTLAAASSTDSQTSANLSEDERQDIDDEAPFDMDAVVQQLTTSSSSDSDDEDDDKDDSDAEEEESDIDDSDENAEDAEDGEDDEDDEDDDSESGQVTVDFGVYDMEKKHIDAVMHLMDQLCPDKMNEIDRDDLGAAFAENPFTYVVKVGDNDADDSASANKAGDEEEEEFYGLVSMLDVAHGLQRHPAAFRPLQTLLKTQVWRTVHAGLPPTEILTAFTDDKAKRAKCGLLVTEYIRNVPVALSVQILDDLVHRLEKSAEAPKGKAPSGTDTDAVEGKDASCVCLAQPCMYAVLAKVQRAVDAPATLVKQSNKKGSRDAQAAPQAAANNEAPLDLDTYIFWRQEDRVLFRFRDTRIATYAYRCRPQYDGQPELEIPLSLLFVLQHGPMLQAIDAIKAQDATKTEVTRFY